MAADTTDPNRTRASLLDGIKDPGNHKRWADFVDAYSNLVRDGARRVGLRNDEIEDVVQIVLIEVSRKASEFAYDRSKGTFRAWICKVTARRAIDQFRKRRPTEERKVHRQPEDCGETDTLDQQEDLDETAVAKMIHEEWMRALYENTLKAVRERVTPEQYQIYDAYAVQNWPIEKVSKVYGVKANQVYIAKTRVGKIVAEEGRRVAEEMDYPDVPPEYPSM